MPSEKKKKAAEAELASNEESDGEKEGITCLHSCCGLPSLFVPSFLQTEGSVRLQGLSSQRPSCTSTSRKQREKRKGTAVQTTPALLYWEEIKAPSEGALTHCSPEGHAVFWGVAEVVGFKRVPEGEDDGSVVRPLEVHLHVCVMEANPELPNI